VGITSGVNATLVDTNSLTLTTASLTGAYHVTANNIITTSGTLNAGSLTLTGSSIQLGGNLITQGGAITLNNPTTLNTDIAITSNNGAINLAAINGSYNLTLNAGSSGNITFNGNVGSSTSLAALNITNANNVTNNNAITAASFIQNAGHGLTSLGNSGFTITNSASISTNNVTGGITVGGLSIGTNFANLTGTVAGLSGQAAIDIITLLNSISAGTHFFDGIDMFGSIPPTPPAPTTDTGIIPQILFPPIYSLNDLLNLNDLLDLNDLSNLGDSFLTSKEQSKSCSVIAPGIIGCGGP
jgi:hypothetical protein